MARSKDKLKRHNICLYEGDYERLQQLNGNRAALTIRTLVRKYLQDHASETLPVEDIEV